MCDWCLVVGDVGLCPQHTLASKVVPELRKGAQRLCGSALTKLLLTQGSAADAACTATTGLQIATETPTITSVDTRSDR